MKKIFIIFLILIIGLLALYQHYNADKILYSQNGLFILDSWGNGAPKLTINVTPDFMLKKLKGEDFDIYYLLGLFNSHLLNWRFKLTSTNNHVNNYEIDELPIPSTCSSNQHLVEQIIALVKLQCRECSESIQDKIDALVYKIYGLNENEVECIKGDSMINKRTHPQLIS